jgi:pimeloyl-ACP methyl ester carboxylesterase
VHVAPRWTAPAPPVDLVSHVEGALAIVHGARDRFIPPVAAHELHAAAPTARLEVVTDLGHGFAPTAVAPVVAAVGWTLE